MTATTQSAARSQFVLLGGFAGGLIISLAVTVLLGTSLAPAEFGFYALIITLFGFGREAIDLGTSSTAAREIARDPSQERPLIEGLVVWRRLMGLLIALAITGLVVIEEDPIRRLVLAATAAAIAAMGPTAVQAAFQARQAHLGPALLHLATQTFMLAACVLLLGAGSRGPEIAATVVVRELLVLVGIVILGRRLIGYRVVPGLRRRDLRRFFASASIWAAAAFCRHLYVQSDMLSVFLFREEAELGALAAAYRPLYPAFTVAWLAVVPLVPVFAAAFQDRSQYCRLLRHAFPLALGVGALAAAFTGTLADDLVALFYGGQYQNPPLGAATAMRWLAGALAPGFAVAVSAVALLAAQREGSVLKVSASGLAFKVVCNAILVPFYGFEVAALTTAVTEWAVFVALGGLLLANWPVAPPVRSLLLAVVPATLVAALGLALPGLPAVRVGIGAAVSMLGILWILVSVVGRDYFSALRMSHRSDGEDFSDNGHRRSERRVTIP